MIDDMTPAQARAALESSLWTAFEHACIYSDTETAERLTAIIMKVGRPARPAAASAERAALRGIWARIDALSGKDEPGPA